MVNFDPIFLGVHNGILSIFFQLWPRAQDLVVSLLGLKSAEGIKQNTIGHIPSS